MVVGPGTKQNKHFSYSTGQKVSNRATAVTMGKNFTLGSPSFSNDFCFFDGDDVVVTSQVLECPTGTEWGNNGLAKKLKRGGLVKSSD